MKKIVSIILTLCLLCGTVAFADTTITDSSETKTASTTVSFSVTGGYTVTIPSAVTIDQETKEGTASVVIAANPILDSGKYLNIYLEKPASLNSVYANLENGSAKIPYKIYKGETDITMQFAAYAAYANGFKLLEAGPGSEERSVTLKFKIPDSTQFKVAGQYSDMLTFRVAVE